MPLPPNPKKYPTSSPTELPIPETIPTHTGFHTDPLTNTEIMEGRGKNTVELPTTFTKNIPKYPNFLKCPKYSRLSKTNKRSKTQNTKMPSLNQKDSERVSILFLSKYFFLFFILNF